MNTRSALLLLGLGVVSVAAGFAFGPERGSEIRGTLSAGQLAFPGLAASLAKAEKIEISKEGKTLTIAQRGPIWTVSDQQDYAARAEKLRGLLTGLTELRLREPRTSDPALFARLGLDDPSKPGAAGTLLRVLDGAGKPIVELIIGTKRARPSGGGEEIYVRKPGETQTWLADGKIEAEADGNQWIDRQIANLEFKEIAAAIVTNRDGERLEFALRDGKTVLVSPAAPAPIEQAKLDDIFRAFEFLSFSENKKSVDLPGNATGFSDFTTKDGLALHAEVAQEGNDVWARFSAKGDGAQKQAADLFNAVNAGWVYKVVTWKQQALVPTLKFLTTNPLVQSGTKDDAAPAEGPDAPPADKPAQ